MASQEAKELLSLGPSEVGSLNDGVNFRKNPEDGKCYIIYKSGEGIRACKNQCKHQGGLFIKDIEDLDGRTVKCTKHNWKLNVSTMKYVNPPDSFLQDELEVEVSDDGGLRLLELNPVDPWLADPRTPLELQEGEVKVTYLTHACMELQLGGKRLMFDPWLKGPAFARGWWLLHEPPEDALDRMCAADLIYISHMHSDHLSYPTLKVLSERRPDMPIYVGDTSRPVFWYLEQSQVKLTNINVTPFGVWQNIDDHLRLMILMDGVHPEMDTCIIVDYKGHMILNTVDCTRPNGGRLPHNVDLMMGDFAGGASGFPMTFYGGKYTESWKEQFIRNERKKLLNYKSDLVRSLQPRIYCPFAGYFVEAHPSDRYIKDTNIKNSPVSLNELINRTAPDIKTWTPKPGAVLDLGLALRDPSNSAAITDPPAGAKIYKDSWEFSLYVDELNRAISSAIFKHPGWIQFYYTWAGFANYNLVVRMVETDDAFEPVAAGYDYLVDFLDLSFPSSRPDREHSYLEIKNRMGVMRHVVLHGGLWDDLYIGFQNRISRDPDVYHHKFWNHFQAELPVRAPDWGLFLQRTPPVQEPDGPRDDQTLWNYCALM
ncbi:cytidine monophosphate-N-acetylneuraminic acid hydroxylase [Salarias fasciatus]|uniref:Cytidine monophosphate-N-acetylneuraminic acid hydroxylase n=1 Tax=Salarias fasciatus TaxID=181472 RepID=A0A672IV82_SALFA|nr:cytidine monophosphate-N-acetylneuraminic acid hydroxylase-like [Salarias fasciatus]XP_029969794.1 cytidine monophosphate-N-acetylneuraminic acid hydroxylase-like [Salarias fasciatus]